MELLIAIVGGGIGAAIVNGLFRLLELKMSKGMKDQRAQCAARAEEIAEVKKQGEASCAANRVILHDRIKYLGKAHIAKGEITAEDLEDIMNMHRCYHNDLGGNGFLDNLMEQVCKLRIVA